MIAVTGPTASGKTRRAVALSRHLGAAEIISGDSRQVYRGMTIGTGKDLEEYGEVPTHLIDIRPAGHKYNLHEYLRDFNAATEDIRARGKMPVLCGGSGMYVEAALNGLRLPEVPRNETLRQKLAGKSLQELAEILRQGKSLHNRTDIDTIARAVRAIEIMEYYREHPEEASGAVIGEARRPSALIIGVSIDREARRERITERLHSRLDEGMVDEVRGLLDSGVAAEDLIYYGLEYKFVTLYLTGELEYDEMVRQLEIAIHQFAKRQMTWFRGMEKRGHKIHWLPYDLPEEDFNASVDALIAQNFANTPKYSKYS
ncbi:MAG: tRNA (adenosine(37)-N6)-dimethylallyltransferase MiaA [Muribaculaceae bacterium]|nr:tRNA (adenosine(37)-N6)-dimethylallyltransferase MiaA [Muribaculaceae bacterium]